MRCVLIAVLAGLMHATRSFTTGADPGSAGTLLAFGYLLMTAFYAGALFHELRLPRLTGYIAVGVAAGPCVLALVSREMVASLDLVNGVAVSMIALTAGSELELRSLKPLLRTIRWITLCGVIGTIVLLAAAVHLMRPLLPFVHRLEPRQAWAVALVLGVVMVAQSPAVVVALRDELRADGVVTRSVLGVVVLADLLVIVLFAVTSTIAKAAFGTPANATHTASALGWEICGSLLVGVAIGALVAAYLKRIVAGAPLFLLLVTVAVAEVGRRLHLDALLVSLAAGMVVRNATAMAAVLRRELQACSLPVSVVFFALAGARIHLDVLVVAGLPATVLVLVRGGGLFFGTRLGARIARAPPAVQRHAGAGLLPQAGLALALSTMFATTFPEVGAEASAVTLAVVALNELFAPALYRSALVRCGEGGRVAPDRVDPAQAELARG